MGYTKTTWVDGTTEITPARLRNLETQYDEVIAEWETNPIRTLVNQALAVEVLASAPSHAVGRIYLNSTDKELYISDGSAWIELSENAEEE
jgi:hypothetical protein